MLVLLLTLTLASYGAGISMYNRVPSCTGSTARCSRCATISAGLRVSIVSVGKQSRDESWVTAAIEQYTSRLRGILDVEFKFVQHDAALIKAVQQCASSTETAIILDERGPQHTSVELSHLLFDGLDTGGSRLSFFIGGAEGLPKELKTDRKRLMSLSKLTLPHQMARVLLVEQVRA